MEELDIKAGSFTGLGATDDAILGIYLPSERKYYKKELSEDFEIASLFGTMSREEGTPYIHAHAVMGNPVEGKFFAGHLEKATISGTCEIHLRLQNMNLGRALDDATGLKVVTFED